MQFRGPIIYASADIHSPHYLPLFKNSLKKHPDSPCLFVLAGDIVDKGKIKMAKPVFRAIRESYPETSIVAVFGNEEYMDREDRFIREYPDIIWLRESVYYTMCSDYKISIVGSRGSLKRPTRWQRKNIPEIEEIYRKRVAAIKELLTEAREKSDIVVLVTHYAVTRATIIGEHPAIHDQLYDPRIEKIIKKMPPDIAIHGHAHKGRPQARINNTPVYNVAFPLLRDIAVIDVSHKITLLDFL
ncbi:MAG: metallophosphoesterase [Desulfurococcales archaeon]|nr:metallophosphoesterase [Desulfurococcales archaeon]